MKLRLPAESFLSRQPFLTKRRHKMKIPITWQQLCLIIIVFLVIYYSVIAMTTLKRKFGNKYNDNENEPRTTRRKWQVNEETTSDDEVDTGLPEQYSAEMTGDFDDDYDENDEVTEEKLFSALEKLAGEIETTFLSNEIINDRDRLFQVLSQQVASYPSLFVAPYKNAITNLITRKLSEYAIVAMRDEILSLWSE